MENAGLASHGLMQTVFKARIGFRKRLVDGSRGC